MFPTQEDRLCLELQHIADMLCMFPDAVRRAALRTEAHLVGDAGYEPDPDMERMIAVLRLLAG
jgi:hypothetical protein